MLRTSITNVDSYRYFNGSLMPFRALLLLVVALALVAFLFAFELEIAAVLQEHFSKSPDYTAQYYADFVALTAWEIVWLCVFMLLACALFLTTSNVDAFGRVGARPGNAHFIILILVVFLSASLYVSYVTFDRFPATPQQHAHLFQAEMFSEGKLWQRTHDLPAFFVHDGIVQHDGIEVSRFGPGWPLLLSTAFELGIPAFVINPLLAVLALSMCYFLARYLYGESVALWSLMALAFTGLFVFNSSSFLPHVLAMLLAISFVAGALLYDRHKTILCAVAAGASIGMMAAVSLYDALLIFVVFAFYFAFRYGWKAISLLLWIAQGALPFLTLLSFYNYAITGNMFLPVDAWAPEESTGAAGPSSVLQIVANIPKWAVLMVYWSSPGWLILFLVLLVEKAKSCEDRVLHPEDYIFPVLMIGHLLYADDRDSVYGPGFMFVGFPFLVLFVVNRVVGMRRKWSTTLLLASLIYAMIKIPVLASREKQIIKEQQDLYSLVRDHDIHNAVVVVASSTSPRRPMLANELTRNDPRFLNDVIYAVSLPGISEQLREYYNDRTFYMYTRRRNESQGSLVRID